MRKKIVFGALAGLGVMAAATGVIAFYLCRFKLALDYDIDDEWLKDMQG